MGVHQKQLIPLEAGVGIAQIALAGPERLDLAAGQDNTGLAFFQKMITEAGFAVVGDDVFGHGAISLSK